MIGIGRWYVNDKIRALLELDGCDHQCYKIIVDQIESVTLINNRTEVKMKDGDVVYALDSVEAVKKAILKSTEECI